MASRRLDISSLLCDDNPTPFSPLEALVHAATEEKRRLDHQHRFHHPPSIAHLISPADPPITIALDSPDPRHLKKRRYSLSPTSDDIIRERDKMFVGELGYGRVDPSFTPRRPGSHSRKPVAVADLLSPPLVSTTHRILSPPGRRSPPGSQIGRAKAARKSDEHHHTSSFPPPPNIQQEDAHEWFLHQFDQVPSPSTRLKPPHPPSPPPSHPLTAAVALEQEFTKKQEPQAQMDLDVDLAVTELVQTMEDDDNKPPTIEVDVEDELLSLVDDRPPPSTTARRPPPSHPPAIPATTKPAPSLTEPRHVSPSPTIPMGISPASAVRHPSTKPTSERGSMPPPASTTVTSAGKKGAEYAGNVVPTPTTSTVPKKKKEAKPKTKATPASTSVAAKPKPKPTAKSKKVADVHLATASISRPTKAAPTKKTAPSGSRSRSTSVMPDAVKAEKQEEEEESDGPDEADKLYCVCKTKYDEDRFMIACDRCDEWYHTQCVHMPDLEVDLVDQFICPPCVEKEPHLNLRTTYKMRCLYGLRHPDPSSTKACHKAARGAFSKYCSDECGVKYMQSRIDSWSKKGGKPEKLWESVKNAEKREGVVICTIQSGDDNDTCSKMEVDVKDVKPPPPSKRVVQPPLKSKLARETEQLDGLLDSVIKLREEIKKGMEAVIWRERLLQLASERAELVGQCGWDQRLCLDDEEWADVGAGVLESYEHVKAESTKEDGVDGEMEADGSEEQWWCPGQKVCDRHQGWQTVRYKDVSKEKEKKEEALMKLTTREREIRKRIEDMLDPQDTNNSNTTTATETTAHAPLKASNTKAVNGHPKSKGATSAADSLKKGKKRKAPAP